MAKAPTQRAARKEAKKADHIPRPPNPWILYRSYMTSLNKETLPQRQGQASKAIAQMWENETDEVKRHFEDLAQVEKRKHAERYPGYRFRPKRLVERESGKQSKMTRRAKEEATALTDGDHTTVDRPVASSSRVHLDDPPHTWKTDVAHGLVYPSSSETTPSSSVAPPSRSPSVYCPPRVSASPADPIPDEVLGWQGQSWSWESSPSSPQNTGSPVASSFASQVAPSFLPLPETLSMPLETFPSQTRYDDRNEESAGCPQATDASRPQQFAVHMEDEFSIDDSYASQVPLAGHLLEYLMADPWPGTNSPSFTLAYEEEPQQLETAQGSFDSYSDDSMASVRESDRSSLLATYFTL
ncbi:hypothetical protein EW146_g1834 [Bondarzewia mesenterica]|uniref:HMG box domain-containing protein n=1 Tax=Bondarzewia mesenterica TaxID=1095465 RepID=A0A4S4M2K8_9AGAM|nr:hypothetical protein EW146_g1834 [Bondarzewia mesenterica]